MVRVAARNYDKAKRVPPEFVAEQAHRVTPRRLKPGWRPSSKSDFSIFRPHLEKVVELVQKYISFFPPGEHPYDTLLDDYEPGMKTADVKAIFDGLRPKQVKLLKAIASSKQVKDDFLYKKYNEKKLMDFGVDVITRFGYDWSRGRQDKAPHPFETTFSVNDVRITTRYEDDNPLATLFSTMHEAGHAMYEQGSQPRLMNAHRFRAAHPWQCTNRNRGCGKISWVAHCRSGSISIPSLRRLSLRSWMV